MDIGLPSPLDNLEIRNGFDARFLTQGAARELPRSENKDLYVGFFSFVLFWLFFPLYLFWSREVLLGW